MRINFSLIAAGLTAVTAYAQALNTTSLLGGSAGCSTIRPSDEERAQVEEALKHGSNTTQRRQVQKHRIPVHITVLAKDNSVEGGNIPVCTLVVQIQQVLNEFDKVYSYGFYLDNSVDTVHRYLRPDLFDPVTGFFTEKSHNILGQYHRGNGDFTALNIIFVYRMQDTGTYRESVTEGGHRSWSSQWSGTSGEANLLKAKPWLHSNAIQLEREDGLVLSTGILPGSKFPSFPGTLSTFPHEVGHWLGLDHTDSPNGNCDEINDSVDDTPAHTLQEGTTFDDLHKCPGVAYDSNCGQLRLTDGQMRRTMDMFEQYRMPYKEEMQRQGRWEEPNHQPPQGQQPEGQQPGSQQPQDDRGDTGTREAEFNNELEKLDQQRNEYARQIREDKERDFNNCLNELPRNPTDSLREKYKPLDEERNEVFENLSAWSRKPEWYQWAENQWNQWEEYFRSQKRILVDSECEEWADANAEPKWVETPTEYNREAEGAVSSGGQYSNHTLVNLESCDWRGACHLGACE
ncbi:metalloprotease-like protein [Cordyceps javanica]|uniref:Metalloprotease-like protein n=1 Tax=Cordyceps javanica TaxID=43265 RepID=A0A545UQ65_9HYPO|nr:metalloprotease-like protein [Cordyceps javanica]